MVLPSTNVLDMFIQVACLSTQQVAIELNEQIWTYDELLSNVTRVVHHLRLEMNQIVCQYVDRSLEMVCGMLGIMCAGGIYCPLNLSDPPKRIHSLLDEIQCRLVLVHGHTREQFTSINSEQVKTIDLEQILLADISTDVVEKEIYIKGDHPSFIICTSGTTGRPKVIVHTHASLVAGLQALINWDIKYGDKVLQVAGSAWLIHVLEIFLALVKKPASTLVLLQPGDNSNMTRLCRTIKDKQITIVMIGSSLLKALLDYLDLKNDRFDDTLKRLRIVWLTGESSKPQHLIKLKSFAPQTFIFISYGQSEVIAPIGYYLEYDVDELSNLSSLPIGHPQIGYKCMLMDETNKRIILSTCSDEIGEIYLRGAGLFQRYYNDPELTKKTRVTINNEHFFKTGDLARYNTRGELVHVGRVDFQIKIRGQRVEASEVESVIMAWSPNVITNCLVVKLTQEEDLIVAYMVSNNLKLDIESLRDYCKERLRQYMIPSHFIVLDKFPLNVNGKIDRKQLPSPPSNVPSGFVKADEGLMSELEDQVHRFWCSKFELDSIPRDADCFALGGSSLTMMLIFNYYQANLVPEKQLDDLEFFTHPTIADHVRLLTCIKTKTSSI
ncbi:unnamed protein product [Adineta steineri]|uniref:Carrier domain-containing protein n=1 Tax=Adineta steineri TaxID=433720 RepID=A0A814VB06_9BILA|nr:unnamed protein product [Adineta steineri]CAF3666769.1 unnamed protein product [Adineta steineri]